MEPDDIVQMVVALVSGIVTVAPKVAKAVRKYINKRKR